MADGPPADRKGRGVEGAGESIRELRLTLLPIVFELKTMTQNTNEIKDDLMARLSTRLTAASAAAALQRMSDVAL